jgi:hypothetical protein
MGLAEAVTGAPLDGYGVSSMLGRHVRAQS